LRLTLNPAPTNQASPRARMAPCPNRHFPDREVPAIPIGHRTTDLATATTKTTTTTTKKTTITTIHTKSTTKTITETKTAIEIGTGIETVEIIVTGTTIGTITGTVTEIEIIIIVTEIEIGKGIGIGTGIGLETETEKEIEIESERGKERGRETVTATATERAVTKTTKMIIRTKHLGHNLFLTRMSTAFLSLPLSFLPSSPLAPPFPFYVSLPVPFYF
jgi:hypothetical protein